MNTDVQSLNRAEIQYARDLGLEVALFTESVKAQGNKDLHQHYWAAIQNDQPSQALAFFSELCKEMDSRALEQRRHVRSVVFVQRWRDMIDQHSEHLEEFAWQFRLGWSQGLCIFGRVLS